MKRIASIVHNSVTRDTRVQKEAVSLSEDLGISYTIIGIQDKNDSRSENYIAKSVKVIRIPMPRLILSPKNLIKKFKELIYPFRYIVFLLLISLFAFSYYFHWGLYTYFSLIFFITYLIKKIGLTVLKKFSFYDECRIVLASYLRFRQFSLVFFPVLQKLEIEVIHAHDFPMLIVASRYKKFFPQTKIVFDAHELFEHMSERGAIYRFFFSRYIKKLSKNVDAFVTINQSFKKYFKTNYPQMPEAYIVKNATSVNLLNHSITKTDLIRNVLNISPDKKILLYQGGYSVARGLDNIIKATKIFHNDWVSVFMGWGANEGELKKLAKDMGLLGTRVFFIPPARLEELTAWTSGADLGIIPYLNTCINHYYCTPNKLWEFPVARVPILVPDYPELARVVDQYDIGWKIPDITPVSIAALVNSLDSEKIKEKSKNIENYFKFESWEVYRQNLTLAYQQVL
jgi:glycosyltransferase involved in cell wall biosynthesis